MLEHWTKATLRSRIIEMQTDIDRISINRNFTGIQRRVLLDFRKRVQVATRAFAGRSRWMRRKRTGEGGICGQKRAPAPLPDAVDA